MTFTDILQIPIRHTEDQTLTLSGVTWEDYQKIIAQESNNLISFFENEITIVSPSYNHERLSTIALLLIVAYCEKFEIDYWALGSTDITRDKIAGKQPDESFYFHVNRGENGQRDLAVEINHTSGSIKDLDKYKALNKVKEIWIWQKDKINFYHWDDNNYQLISQSKVLDKLTSDFVNQFVNLSRVNQSNNSIKREFSKGLEEQT